MFHVRLTLLVLVARMLHEGSESQSFWIRDLSKRLKDKGDNPRSKSYLFKTLSLANQDGNPAIVMTFGPSRTRGGDKSWINSYDPKTNRQSAQWMFRFQELATKVCRNRKKVEALVRDDYLFLWTGHFATIALEDKEILHCKLTPKKQWLHLKRPSKQALSASGQSVSHSGSIDCNDVLISTDTTLKNDNGKNNLHIMLIQCFALNNSGAARALFGKHIGVIQIHERRCGPILPGLPSGTSRGTTTSLRDPPSDFDRRSLAFKLISFHFNIGTESSRHFSPFACKQFGIKPLAQMSIVCILEEMISRHDSSRVRYASIGWDLAPIRSSHGLLALI
ncbi:hypothetical protein EVAR_24705_1 [Eumeta japonica]|uniref:Mariner Mos1 transposase n=1 Tax=Eumeta variegata TaxID=151549 RepID=A0A4C1VDK1_EUMVA|nr:hypothetical protein EVAR_24705_1 [Eumeta japonica]